uniref:Retrovirus-related Pol polyprotein from transposon TNT 1-94 n=1 Tax=Tanacetum cinerariifolium TaxID=118510 RepID=A0A6L2KK88_TANCI|nr:retrovirus-related Pol polyprotein from transposon TNT 1-94 [Tanacetum cinerariifolium]
MNDFFSMKGIKRECSNARTPQQNGVAKRRNRTLIEAARTMLADAKLLVTFWAEVVNTACYVQNMVLGGMRFKDNDLKIKIQAHRRANNESKEFPRTQGSKFKEGFNTIITSLKELDESFLSRNHVRKFLRALPTKWHPKVTTIEESKDLSTLPLDELIDNLKAYEVVLEKDLETSRKKKEKYKSLALKARKVLSEEEATSSDSNDEEYVMAVRDFKKFFRRRGKFVRQPYDDKRNFWKAKEDKNDSEDDSKKEEICLMALDDNEVLSDTPYDSSSSLDNESWQNEPFSGKTPYELFKGKKYFKVFGSKCFILNTKDYLTKFNPKSTEGIFLGYSPNSKAYVILNRETMRVEESLNVKFNESPPPETPPLENDDVLKNKNIEKQEKDLEIKENEPLNKKIPNIKESKDHPLENIIGNLNDITLRSQVQSQNNFFCFVSTIEPKNIKEAIQDKSWSMAMQEELTHLKQTTSGVLSLLLKTNLL